MSKIKINVKDEVTSVLPFKPFAEFNNLCLGYLTGVEVVETEAKEDSQWEYAGMTIPRLTFIFTQHKHKEEEKTRMFFHTELPLSSVKVTGEAIPEKNLVIMYSELWKRIKHIHDMYIGTENYKEIKSIPEFDPDETPQERLVVFKKFFDLIAKAFNEGKDKTSPIYTPYGGVGNSRANLLAIKLVAGGKNNNRLVFPTFVGTGLVERVSIVKGKLDTTLAFRTSETTNLGGSGVMPAGTANMASEVSEDIASQLLDN